MLQVKNKEATKRSKLCGLVNQNETNTNTNGTGTLDMSEYSTHPWKVEPTLADRELLY